MRQWLLEIRQPLTTVRLQRRGRPGLAPEFPVRRKTQMGFPATSHTNIQFKVFRLSVNPDYSRPR